MSKDKDQYKVLILRTSSAGDVVHGLPVAAALKRLFANCRVGWLVEDRFADLLRDNSAVDALHVIPRRQWKDWSLGQRFSSVRGILKQIRTEQYDAALDLQGLTKSSIAGFLARIPLRVGFSGNDGRGGRELSRFFNNDLVEAHCTHVVDRNLELLGGLNVSDEVSLPDQKTGVNRLFKVEFPLPELKSEKIDDFLGGNGLADGNFVIINPGAGWPAKLWSTDCFAEVAGIIRERTGLPVVISWGGAKEREMAEEIRSKCLLDCILAPDTDLKELWTLLSKARLYVGLDTGPSHMAAAAQTDVVAVFGPTSGERNGPKAPDGTSRVRIVQGKCEQFPLCWKKRYRDACRCMASVKSKEVANSCLSLLEN